jgi:3D (Asp-Asp-Asp) domain-containing protein
MADGTQASYDPYSAGVVDPTDPSSDLAAETTLPTLAEPAGSAAEQRFIRPQVLADVFQVPDTPVPSWVKIWRGSTPVTQPSRAWELSRTDAEAYADWLRSTLPAGCTVRREWATVTAYCPCAICCDERTGVTAAGRNTNLHPYGIAADWSLLRRGTKVHVPGYLTESNVGGIWPVDDTGGALRRSHDHGVLHLDVRYASHWWAQRWGTRRMVVYIVNGPVDVNDVRRVDAPTLAPAPSDN